MIVVTGISGVGKTYTIAAFVSGHSEYRHVSASTILLELGLQTQNLTSEEADRNQLALKTALEKLSPKSADHLIIDGHAVIETDDGPVVATTDAFSALQISGIVTIIDMPNSTHVRRLRKSRADSEATVSGLQDLEIKSSADWAARLGVKFATTRSGDVAAFARAIESITRPMTSDGH